MDRKNLQNPAAQAKSDTQLPTSYDWANAEQEQCIT